MKYEYNLPEEFDYYYVIRHMDLSEIIVKINQLIYCTRENREKMEEKEANDEKWTKEFLRIQDEINDNYKKILSQLKPVKAQKDIIKTEQSDTGTPEYTREPNEEIEPFIQHYMHDKPNAFIQIGDRLTEQQAEEVKDYIEKALAHYKKYNDDLDKESKFMEKEFEKDNQTILDAKDIKVGTLPNDGEHDLTQPMYADWEKEFDARISLSDYEAFFDNYYITEEGLGTKFLKEFISKWISQSYNKGKNDAMPFNKEELESILSAIVVSIDNELLSEHFYKPLLAKLDKLISEMEEK